jgi:hypothetical protein
MWTKCPTPLCVVGYRRSCQLCRSVTCATRTPGDVTAHTSLSLSPLTSVVCSDQNFHGTATLSAAKQAFNVPGRGWGATSSPRWPGRRRHGDPAIFLTPTSSLVISFRQNTGWFSVLLLSFIKTSSFFFHEPRQEFFLFTSLVKSRLVLYRDSAHLTFFMWCLCVCSIHKMFYSTQASVISIRCCLSVDS